MQTLKKHLSFNPLLAARWLIILEVIALLFSPPLTNFCEIALLILFLFFGELRKLLVLATKQPMVMASLLFYLLILIGTTYSIETWGGSFSAFWSWRKILLLPMAAALFDEQTWKQKLILNFIKIAAVCAFLSFASKILNFQLHNYAIGIIVRNHATQGVMFAVAAFSTATLLIMQPTLFTKVQKIIYLIFIFALVSNVIYVTPGRSGYLALIVSVLMFTFAYIRVSKKYFTPLIILLIIPLLLISSPTVRQRISQGASEAELYKSKAEATSMGIRMILWNNTLDLIRTRPILGYGTGGFQTAYTSIITSKPSWEQSITHDPHNQFLKITAELGLIGLVVFISFIFSCFWQKVEFSYRVLGIGVLLVWCGNSFFSSHFSTFSEGRFIFLWCGAMLTNLASKNPLSNISEKLT